MEMRTTFARRGAAVPPHAARHSQHANPRRISGEPGPTVPVEVVAGRLVEV
jgi:hypothetical protein